MRVPDPKANTTTEAYLAYKAGYLEESELKPVLYEPYLHFDAWLAYWAGLTETYPTDKNENPEMLTDEEALVAYLSGVTDTYPEEIKDPYDVRIVGYLKYLVSARWGRPEYPVNNEEFYLSTMKPPVVPSGDPSSDIEMDDTAEAPFIDLKMYGDTYQQTYSGKNLINYTSYAGKSGAGAVTLADGKVKIEQDATTGGNCYVYFDVNRPDLANRQVTFYAKGISGGGSTGTRVRFTQISTSTENASALFPTSDGASKTFTVPSNGEMRFYFYANASNVPGAVGAYSEYSEIQLELGSTATSFEPYTAGPAPNPDYPQAVQTVTGEQTVTVTGDDEASQTYTIDLGTTELCKISDYQDYIYKSGDDWYVHKEIGKYIFTGSESWGTAGEAGSGYYGYWCGLSGNGIDILRSDPNYYMTHLKWKSYGYNTREDCFMLAGGTGRVSIVVVSNNSNFANVNSFKTWLSNNSVTFYYPLATPTDTQITDATLIGQLNALKEGGSYEGKTYIKVTATDPNLPGLLYVEAGKYD